MQTAIPESTLAPLRENATGETASECPWNVRSSAPVAVPHSLTVLSLLPDSNAGTVTGSRDWYANVGKGYLDEADLQRIIGQRITLGCFTDDPKITTCHHVVSLDHQRRNIIKR